MPDEERVRTKRRKLDSIITKLHEAVPLGSESLEEEENLNEAVKENVDIDKRNEPLPGSSRRKLHRTAKQNQIDKNAHPQAKPQVTDDAIESHVTENGMEVDGEQEVCCNGEGNASNEIQAVCVPAVVKEEHVENYENSLEGLQQMLGYSISEEVVDTKEDASGKKKRLLSESSDADGHELPRRVECTACGRNVNPAHGTICRHPCLHALVCKSTSILPTKKITKVIKGDNKAKGSEVMVKYGDEELEATIIEVADDQTKLLHLDTEFVATNRHLLTGAVDSNSQSAPPTSKRTNIEEQSKELHDVQSTSPKSTGDPYLKFLSKQKKREKEWKTNRHEAKKTKLDSSIPPGPKDATTDATSDSITELRKQLAAKTEECSRLRIRLKNTEGALEKQQHNQESFFQILEKIQASVSGLGEKVAVGFANLKKRLDVLESQPVKPYKLLNATINSGCVNETVDIGNNSKLSEDKKDIVTINFDALNKLSEEDQPETSPVYLPPVQPTSAALKVAEELIGTCVTPTKIKRVQQILEKESERHLCALKLLPYFFSNEELATSNTDGSHEKKRLKPNKLNALKVLVFSKFPISSSVEKDKAWRLIKSKINSKCRAAKHLV